MIHTSAPGTLMLMGEHAVLHGKHALVATTDQRLHIYMAPRQDLRIQIDSALGKFEFSLDQLAALEICPPFTFVLAAIKQYESVITTGFSLNIVSDFSATVGLGSSAAILVALHLALAAFCHRKLSSQQLFDHTYQSLLTVQGCGSGADLAAAIVGGIICYRQQPCSWQKLNFIFPISLVYAGYKTPTPHVIKWVEKRQHENPLKYAKIFTEIDHAVLNATHALCNKNIYQFAELFRINQNLMHELGVVDSTLTDIITWLEQDPHILAAKVSGSGLGDCVIGIGQASLTIPTPYSLLHVALGEQGGILHEN